MINPDLPRRTRLIIALCVILIGFLLAFVLLKLQYDHCAYKWLNDLDGFAKKYDSVWDCFITRSTGDILVSGIISFAALGLGWSICRKR